MKKDIWRWCLKPSRKIRSSIIAKLPQITSWSTQITWKLYSFYSSLQCGWLSMLRDTSETSFALSYSGVSVVSSHSLLQGEANQNSSSLLHRLFPGSRISPLNFIKFPKHKPKTCLIRQSGWALTDIGSTSTHVKLHFLCCSPSGMSPGWMGWVKDTLQKQEFFPPILMWPR